MALVAIEPHLLAENKLLASLSREDYERLRPHLRLVHLDAQETVYDHGESVSFIYFPLNCVVSTAAIMDDGAIVEFNMTGREGAIGVASLFGELRARNWMSVLIAGHALRIEARTLRELFLKSDGLSRRLMRAYRAEITQISRRVVCNARHTLLQRLSCWLLMLHDRMSGDNIQLTQEVISNRLGARRAGVTVAARQLLALRAIKYNRGLIHIEEREVLHEYACECYKVFSKEFGCFDRAKIGGGDN